ncbi:MAG TPA: type II toxin-antitoxin system RelE/ParE family toxin [Thermodesulfobacteriota bacterium]|nr:type II toxin-antitoxin system RelE/ParE family toxin [Thermodesulfobacteriota bacterium]
MVIIETKVFTKQVVELLSDDEYKKLQAQLVESPEAGSIIKGSGGLRKIRWVMKGRGKRGGVRIIYYWAVKDDILLMLLIYPKSEQDDLTSKQTKILRKIVEEEFR